MPRRPFRFPFAAFAALALPLAAVATPACAQNEVPAAERKLQKEANKEFERIAKRFIATSTRFSPVDATMLGEHDYDSELPDITPLGRTTRAAEWSALLTGLAMLDQARLSRDNQVDQELLANELRLRLWSLDTMQDWAWNPQVYNDAAAGSLYLLAARDFAPWSKRLKSATARMEALPGFLAETRRQLVPARVPRVFAETVASQNGGIVEVA